MKPELNQKYLITTDHWFFAPDGKMYRGAFGTVTSVKNDKDLLEIKTNNKSTNWYIIIGNLIIAGCQIHYCIRTESVDFSKFERDIEHDGELKTNEETNSRIYNADNNGNGIG